MPDFNKANQGVRNARLRRLILSICVESQASRIPVAFPFNVRDDAGIVSLTPRAVKSMVQQKGATTKAARKAAKVVVRNIRRGNKTGHS